MMKYSFIIPAFNEERLLPECIKSIRKANIENNYEIIVVDNLCTDTTVEIALKAGCIVQRSYGMSIGAVRNDGALAALGEWLVFIDADTTIDFLLLHQIRSDVIAGGALLQLDEVSDIGLCFERFWNNYCKKHNIFSGSFMFCRKDIFRELHGFDTYFKILEDVEFSYRLNKFSKSGNFKTQLIISHHATTSGRKLRLFKWYEHIGFWLSFMFRYKHTITSRQKLWYSGRR